MFNLQLTKAKKLIKSSKLKGAVSAPSVEIEFKDSSVAALISIMTDSKIKGKTITLPLKDASREQLLQFLAISTTK